MRRWQSCSSYRSRPPRRPPSLPTSLPTSRPPEIWPRPSRRQGLRRRPRTTIWSCLNQVPARKCKQRTCSRPVRRPRPALRSTRHRRKGRRRHRSWPRRRVSESSSPWRRRRRPARPTHLATQRLRRPRRARLPQHASRRPSRRCPPRRHRLFHPQAPRVRGPSSPRQCACRPYRCRCLARLRLIHLRPSHRYRIHPRDRAHRGHKGPPKRRLPRRSILRPRKEDGPARIRSDGLAARRRVRTCRRIRQSHLASASTHRLPLSPVRPHSSSAAGWRSRRLSPGTPRPTPRA